MDLFKQDNWPGHYSARLKHLTQSDRRRKQWKTGENQRASQRKVERGDREGGEIRKGREMEMEPIAQQSNDLDYREKN